LHRKRTAARADCAGEFGPRRVGVSVAIALLSVATLLAPPAASTTGPLEAVLECRSLSDPVARLACFDRATDALAGATSPTSAGATVAGAAAPPSAPAAPPPPPPASAASSPTMESPESVARGAPAVNHVAPAKPLDSQEEFGMRPSAVAAAEVAAGVRAPEVKKIAAAIVAIGRTADGRFVFTLDNGQVWRQLLLDGDLLAKAGDQVTIGRGLFGSFWLEAPSGRGCKVSRVD
jgi:hypothetical protein